MQTRGKTTVLNIRRRPAKVKGLKMDYLKFMAYQDGAEFRIKYNWGNAPYKLGAHWAEFRKVDPELYAEYFRRGLAGRAF